MEIVIVAAIIVFVAVYNRIVDLNQFAKDNAQYFTALKEKDYEFYARAKYGSEINVEDLFMLRLKNAMLVFVVFMFVFITSLSIVNVLLAVIVAYMVFKQNYTSLKRYYKTHLHEIDAQLPYYLKSLEILAQHYTIPVAMGKSINTAPDIFKPGLEDLIAKINAGDSSIDPYMEFAQQYPVRDSMRMMRLLYRLGLGSNDHKQEQLMMFSRNVSVLQNKSREMKYKQRLSKMEKKTLLMLVVTGGGSMLVMLVSIFMSIGG